MKTPLGLLFLCVFAVSEEAASAANAAQPWDQPFSTDTAQILKAANALPISEKAEILYLLQDRHYEIQANGATTTTFRCLYRVAKQSAVEDWAEVEQEWAPWHESKPMLRARVISANGSVHWLDPKTIADAAAVQFDATIFSDSRVIRAPLPAVDAGSIVEYEIVHTETTPLFAAGVTRELSIGPAVPVERFHVVIDAAKGISIKTGARLLKESDIIRSDSKNGTHIEVDIGRQEAREDFESSPPPDVPQSPAFLFSTGSSWRTIATQYQKIVDQATATADAKALFSALDIDPAKLPADSLDRASLIASHLHKNVRYTGVEFGQAAIVPNPPSEVTHRRYGDCKDKAVLLVTLLKAVGLDAHLALLQAGSGLDVDPALPGLGEFNHAIVFVNGAKPLWIDATAESTRIGTLPTQDQGRLALIVDPATTALSTTPQSASQDNRVVYNIEIRFRESRNANIQVNLEAYGSFESQLRSFYSADAQQTRQRLEFFAKKGFGAKSLGAFSVTPREDFAKPFRMSVEAVESAAAVSDTTEAVVALSNGLLLESLPYGLINAGVNTGKDPKPRVSDFVFYNPYSATVNFKIWPPSGASPKVLPGPSSFTAGDFSYQVANHTNPDGSVEFNYSLDTGKRRITPAEYQTLSQGLAKIVKSSTVLEFTFKTGDLLALGKSAEALRWARQDVTDHPQNVAAFIRYARLLMDCGAGDRAVATAQQAVQLDPKSADAWYTLGTLYQYDSFGRLRAAGWNPAEAEKALRRASALDENNPELSFELAILLEFDANGQRYSKSARLPEAIELYRKALARQPNLVISQNLVFALMHSGQYKEAREQATSDLAGQPLFPAIRIAITALIEGADRAIIDSQSSVGSENRAASLLDAGKILLELRHYQESVELTKAAQRLSNEPRSPFMTFLAKAKRYDESLAAEDDPKRPVQLLLAAIGGFGPPDDQLRAILSERADLANWRNRVWRARESFAPVSQPMLSSGITPEVVADFNVGNSELTVHGDGHPAYLVDIVSHMSVRLSNVVVVKENGKCKLLAPNDSLAVVGKLALERLDKGDLAGAQAWLDQIKDNALPIAVSDDKGPAFRYLWAGTAPETRSAPFVRAAAASLMGTYDGSDDAVRILRSSVEHPVQFLDRADLYFALCETFKRAQRWKELLEASRLLAKSNPYNEVAYRFSGEAHIHLQEWRELQAEAEARLQGDAAKNQKVITLQIKPGQPPSNIKSGKLEDGWALYFDALACLQQGRYDQLQSIAEREKEAVFHSPHEDDRLSAQWVAILSGKPDPNSADDSSDHPSFLSSDLPNIYTKAMTLITAGELPEAKKTLAAALNMEQTGERVSSLPWLVQAEMLKRYGLDTDAAAAFAKAKKIDDWGGVPAAQFLLTKELTAQSKN